jgi:hypothetical protein
MSIVPLAAMRRRPRVVRLHHDGGTPASLFELLAAIVEDRTWERLRDAEGKPFQSFTAFVEATEPEGLGTTADELKKIIELEHPHESGEDWGKRAPWLRAEVKRLLNEDVAQVGPHGFGPGRGHTESVRDTNSLERSDTSVRTVARLKRDDPELAERVVKGEVSANAAALAKGWRKPRVVLTSPESVAERIREHFTPDEIARLVKLLIEG